MQIGIVPGYISNNFFRLIIMRKNKIVTIGIVQSTVSENAKANISKALEQTEQAAKAGAKIICLQELYRTLYFPQKITKNFDQYAEDIPGKSTEAFSRLAKKFQVVIIIPLFERAKNGKYYNSAVVINEKGKLMETYRKIHIPQDPGFYEKDYFEDGDNGYKVYKTKYATFAVLICYDQWFPEAARAVALGGADIIFYPTAIGTIAEYGEPEGDWHDAWETVQRGHAIANSVYVVAVNRIGVEDKLKFFGQSFVCDPFGRIIKRASANREETLVVKLDLGKNKTIRNDWGFFHNRRPDTYRKLVS